jgi:hypothetical protein
MTDVVDAVRTLIEDPRLSRYFHLGQRGRTGVQVVDATSGAGVTSVRAIATQAVIAPPNSKIEAGRIALYLDRVKCADEIASLEWRLPDEGINGAASLRRSVGQGWAIEKFHLVER